MFKNVPNFNRFAEWDQCNFRNVQKSPKFPTVSEISQIFDFFLKTNFNFDFFFKFSKCWKLFCCDQRLSGDHLISSVSLYLKPLLRYVQIYVFLIFLKNLKFWNVQKMFCCDHWQSMWSQNFVCFALSLTVSELKLKC